MAKRARIPIDQPASGLNAAFAGLEMAGLPAGPEELPPASPAKPAKPGRVVLRREKAGRGGKTVLVLDGFASHHAVSDLEELLGEARVACGCGGTLKDRKIEIQGSESSRLREFLEQKGFQVAGVH